VRELIQITTGLGHQIEAFDEDAITQEIVQRGVYDHWTLKAIEHLLTSINADTCLDVGANIGNHALSMSGHCQKVIAFEPVPFIYSVLTQNLQNNVSNAVALCVALSDKQEDRTIQIPLHGNLGQSSMATGFQSAEQVGIKAVVGDDFLSTAVADTAGSAIDFIKIDVEGYESQVVAGLQKTIAVHQPLVLLEWNSTQTRDGFSQHGFFETVFKDYKVFSLTHRHSKQVCGRGISGVLRRIVARTAANSFCVGQFEVKKDFPNVLLIPARWHSLIAELPQCGQV